MSYRCTQLIYKGDNLDRYLLGRQFMVILIVFIVELCGATHGVTFLVQVWIDWTKTDKGACFVKVEWKTG